MNDIFIKFNFPDYQPFMELDGYRENTVTPIPLSDTNEFDASVMIRKSWLENITDFSKFNVGDTITYDDKKTFVVTKIMNNCFIKCKDDEGNEFCFNSNYFHFKKI